MRTMGGTVKKTAVILAVAAMVPAAGFAFGGHWGGGKPKGPPQEAIGACAGKSEGDAVRFTTPCGDPVSAVCRDIRGRLTAVPEGGPWARLDLTEEQRKQVKAILESEREKVAPLRKKLAETREKIRKAVETEPFDEAAVRALAESRNETRVELIVSRARVRSRIFALLTPEQRERARKLRPWGAGRHGHHPWR